MTTKSLKTTMVMSASESGTQQTEAHDVGWNEQNVLQ